MSMKILMMDGFVQMLIANTVRNGRSMNIVVMDGGRDGQIRFAGQKVKRIT